MGWKKNTIFCYLCLWKCLLINIKDLIEDRKIGYQVSFLMPFFSQISENFCLFDFLYSSLPILKRCSDNFLTNLACHHKIVNFDFNYKFDDSEWLNIFFSKNKNNNKKFRSRNGCFRWWWPWWDWIRKLQKRKKEKKPFWTKHFSIFRKQFLLTPIL